MAADPSSSPAKAPSLWTLRLTLAALWILAMLFGLAMLYGTQTHQAAMKAVGKDSAPSILASQNIKTALADMHTSVANILLGEPGKASTAVKSYDDRRQELTNSLVSVTDNITYDERERAPIRQLMNQLGHYESAVARARLLHEQEAGPEKVTGKDETSASLRNYREADRIMNEGLFPAADALEKVNRDELSKEYEDQKTSAIWVKVWLFLSGGALLVALLGAKVLLRRSGGSALNLPLGAAALLTGAAVGLSLYLFNRESKNLRVLKEDAYDSLAVLWKARADAFDANGDESRWLLDRAEAAKYEKAFTTKADRIAQLPPGMSAEQLLADVKKEQVPSEFKGYLATELRNITFEGERAAAVPTLEKWLDYVKIDRQIRQLQQEGKHDDAVKLCLGRSDDAFSEFNKALGATIDINQLAFNDIMDNKSPATLLPMWFAAPLAALAIAVLAFLGMRPRMHELEIAQK